MVKTYVESAIELIIWRQKKKGKCTKVQKIKKGREEGQVHLIKLLNLKYNACDKNYKMFLAIGYVAMS